MPHTKSDISRWQCWVWGRTNTQALWASPTLLVFTKMEGVRPRGRYVGPRGGPRACAWDADAVQSVASIELSVLGNIALQTKSENPDLVENISTADVDVLGCQWAEWSHHRKTCREIPPCYSDEYAREHAQINRKSVYGRCVWLSYGRVSYAD